MLPQPRSVNVNFNPTTHPVRLGLKSVYASVLLDKYLGRARAFINHLQVV